jgi:hypothetical protein
MRNCIWDENDDEGETLNPTFAKLISQCKCKPRWDRIRKVVHEHKKRMSEQGSSSETPEQVSSPGTPESSNPEEDEEESEEILDPGPLPGWTGTDYEKRKFEDVMVYQPTFQKVQIEYLWDEIRNIKQKMFNASKEPIDQVARQIDFRFLSEDPRKTALENFIREKINYELEWRLQLTGDDWMTLKNDVRDLQSQLYDELKHPDRLTEPKMRKWADSVIETNEELRAVVAQTIEVLNGKVDYFKESLEQQLLPLTHKVDMLGFDIKEIQRESIKISYEQ